MKLRRQVLYNSGGSAVQLESEYEDKQYAKYRKWQSWFLRKGFLAFLFHYYCFCPAVLSADKLGQKTFKMRRSKHTFSLSGWLTVQKMSMSWGKTFSWWNFQVKTLKFLQKKKKICSLLSLGHAGMSLASGKLLWFSTGVHQRSKPNLFLQIQTPWTEKHLAGFSFFPVCEVLIILKHHRHPGTVQFSCG